MPRVTPSQLAAIHALWDAAYTGPSPVRLPFASNAAATKFRFLMYAVRKGLIEEDSPHLYQVAHSVSIALSVPLTPAEVRGVRREKSVLVLTREELPDAVVHFLAGRHGLPAPGELPLTDSESPQGHEGHEGREDENASLAHFLTLLR